MEPSIIAEAFKGLVAAGPVAMILGIFCYALWQQNQKLIDKQEKQSDKMLRLAVRVQRAVEVLAGLDDDTPEVEKQLDADDRAEGKDRDRLGDRGR